MSFFSYYKNQVCITDPQQRSCPFILSKDQAAEAQNATRISTKQIRKVGTNFFYFKELFPLVLVD